MRKNLRFKVGDTVYFKNSYTGIPIRGKVAKKLPYLKSYLISLQQLLPKEENELYATEEEAKNAK